MKLPKINTKLFSFFAYGTRIEPFRDWSVLISAGILLLLVSALWNTWLFYRVFNGDTLEPQTSSSAPSFTTESLTKAEEIFSKRAAEESRYRNEYRFVDPSL